jgi:hypothetical protein
MSCAEANASQPINAIFIVTSYLRTAKPDLFRNMKSLHTFYSGENINVQHFLPSLDTPFSAPSKTRTALHAMFFSLPAAGVETTAASTGVDVIERRVENRIAPGPASDQPLYPGHTPAIPLDSGPIPEPLLDPPPITSIFHGIVSGAKALIGADSFCQGFGFISPIMVDRLNMVVTPINPMQVQLGDGISSQTADHACKVHIKLGSFSTTTWLIVMPLPSSLDLLLGDLWLVTNNVHLLFDRKCMVIWSNKRKHIWYTVAEAENRKLHNRTPKYQSHILSAVQFRKQVVKKHLDPILCFISKESPIDPSSADPTTSDQHDLSKFPSEIASLIRKYPAVFPTTLIKPNPLRGDMPTVIDTIPTAKIPNKPLYRYNPVELAEIEKQVQDLLAQNLIQPSTSPYGAPVLLVKKKDGSMRMCIDYRALNSITTKNAYPLPRIDDLLDKLQGAKYFSSLDLLSGYHQLTLQPQDVPKTAFKTTFGLFEFKVLCFGLTNAPSVFQNIMNKIFSTRPNMLNKFVLVYMDDILIFSKTKEEHLQHIEQVIRVLQVEGLSAKLKKCQFFQPELKFLGHVVSAKGIHPDPDKIEAVQNWPVPHTQTELKGFLGLTNYFRKFIKNYSHLASPLTDLTRKSLGTIVTFTPAALSAFTALKEKLVTAPVLAVPDFSKPFKIVCDASQIGLGGVLLQDDQPLAYESKKFTLAEKNYSTTDRELYAAVYCLKKWKIYMLHNPENVLETDHKPNTTINTKQDLSPRQIRWIDFLQQFNIKWVYGKGSKNLADPLSRFNTYFAAMSLSPVPTTDTPSTTPLELFQLLPAIKHASTLDPFIAAHPNLVESDGVYFHHDRIYVPNASDLRTKVISAHHDSLFCGHMGKNHTAELVHRWFYWPNMQADVAHYVANCHTCQTAKASKTNQQGLLNPLPVPDRPWWSVSIDFITGLPMTSKGHDAILTIVDRLTRLTHLVLCTTTCSAVEFADLFKQHVIAKHGCPADIVSDRGAVFTGRFWTAVCSALQMHMSMSTAFHPQSDGSTEVVNKMVEQVLRCHCMDQPTQWDSNLCMVEFAINNSHHESLTHTPFFLNYGMHPITPVTLDTLRLSKVPAAATWTKDLTSTLESAKQHLQLAKDRQKSYADANRQDVVFSTGDLVLLSSKNLNPKTGLRKLYPRWLGPFLVTQVINPVAYRLALPSTMKVHPVFHVSLLKAYHHTGPIQPPPQPVVIDDDFEYEVEDILKHRLVKSGKRNKQEFLIKWKGYGFEHCTWEPQANLSNCSDILATYWRTQALKDPSSKPEPLPLSATTRKRART